MNNLYVEWEIARNNFMCYAMKLAGDGDNYFYNGEYHLGKLINNVTMDDRRYFAEQANYWDRKIFELSEKIIKL